MQHIADKMNDAEFIANTPEDYAQIAKELGDRYAKILQKQMGEKDAHILRGSSLGRPVVELMAKRFFPEWWENNQPTERLMRIFHDGLVFELQFEWFLYRFGKLHNLLTAHNRYNLSEALETNLPVFGELDYVINLDDGIYLVDTKTANSSGHRKILYGMIPREYLVQLAVYKAAWEKDSGKRIAHAGLLVCNKDNSLVSWVEADSSQLDEALTHAKLFCQLWEDSSSWEEAIANGMKPPEPVPEVYRNRPTGAYLLPDSMKYQPKELIDACYDTIQDRNGYGKETIYVVEVKW